MAQGPFVGADILCIPDGADSTTLRIGLQVTPAAFSQIGGDIALDAWPAAVAGLAERIRVRFGKIVGDQVTEVGSVVTHSQLADFFEPAKQWGPKSRREAANAMWQDIFQHTGFDALLDAIDGMGQEPSLNSLQFASTRIADLQLVLDRLIAWHEARMPAGRAALTPEIKLLARRLASWARTGPGSHAAPLAARPWTDPMRERADQLETLDQGIALLLQQNTGGPGADAAAIRFATEFEAEIGTMFREHWTRLFGAGDAEAPSVEPPTDNWGTAPVEAAGRKLSGLLALPTLSHYLGLGIQIAIPRESLTLGADAIAAEFVAEDGSRVGGETAWTAFELVDTHFGPAVNPAMATSVGAFRQGYLNLGAAIDGRTPRFALRSDDVVNAIHDLIQAVVNGDDPVLKRYRRGLVVYDRATTERLKEDETWAAQGGSSINYLNDLLVGFRPDFGVALRGAASVEIEAKRWRPTTTRTIICTHPELDETFYNEPLIVSLSSRDHGYTTAVVEQKDGAASREDEMFVWAGESLAVHAKRKGEPDPVVDPRWDLALPLTYALPVPGSALGMPPLRENVGYACGCRLVYVNGAGPDFASAAAFYASQPSAVIGNDKGQPFLYPPAPLPPPDVHLGWTDPLLEADKLDVEAVGEASDVLVLRDGAGSARRIITPPRGSFDGAEQQRQLDDPSLKEDRPRGALSGTKGIWLFGPDGSFPEARFGKQLGGIRYLDGKQLVHVPLNTRKLSDIDVDGDYYKKKITWRQSRGTVAILGTRRHPAGTDSPFYPDANGGRLRASFERASLDDSRVPPVTADRDFWKAPSRPAAAVPIVIDVLPTATSASLSPARDLDIEDVNARTINLPYMQFALPKGETYQLRLKGDNRRGDEAEVVLRLVHAVEKPLRAPDFIPKEAPDQICATNGIGLRAVTATVQSDDPKAKKVAGLETWAVKVRAYEASGVDMRCWPSEEGGRTTFFTGRVDFDRKSTGSLRCEVVWEEFNEGTVSRKPDGTWVRNIGRETAQLFKFDVERRGGEARLDLLRIAPTGFTPSAAATSHALQTGVLGELRTLSYAFRDGRARKLKVKIIATSAFTAFYPKDSSAPPTGEALGRHDIESSRFATAPTVWTDCTFRPPPPVVDRVLPLLAWEKIPDQAESTRRMGHVRLLLGEGWYASGENERLGIVLLEGEDPGSVCDYQVGALEPYHRFISQAGSDPVRVTDPVPLRLEPRHFRNAPLPVQADLYLPEGNGPSLVSGQSAGAIAPLPVTILPFAPHFSEEEGLYCDLEFDIGDSYSPFVRLGLVRYQEHGVQHLRVSNPIAFDIQLVPERRLWVEYDPNGRGKRTVVIEGPGFDVPTLGQPAHQPNAVRLATMSWNAETHEWRESLVIADRLEPEIDAVTRGYRWRADFTLPVVTQPETFILVAEEYERLPLDTPTGSFHDGEAIFEETAGERLVFASTLALKYRRIQ